MDTKGKLILAMIAMCILITPAFSQGGARDGPIGNPERNIGPAQDNPMMSGPNGMPFGQGDYIEQDQAPNVPRFNGCNTRLQKMSAKGPIKPPTDAPNAENKLGPLSGPNDEPAPWSNLEHDHWIYEDGPFGFAGADKHALTRSIMDHDGPKVPLKKSMMEKKHHKIHKKPLKHLEHRNFPELPPMKSIMNHRG